MTAKRRTSKDRQREFDFNTAPNFLTLFRMFLVPAVVSLLFLKTKRGDVAACVVFILASITDYFDGYLARTQQAVTIYGKLMDPLADKFLVVSSLIMLQYLDRIHPALVILLICRELAITGLRALASAEGVIIPATLFAKLKTILQMLAIPCLMLKRDLWSFPTYDVGLWLIYLSLFMSLWSALDYIVAFFKEVQLRRKRRHRA